MAQPEDDVAGDANTRGYTDAVLDAVLALTPRPLRRPWLIGLSGLQGSGKSTLAAQLVAQARTQGRDAIALSLDDFYFGRGDRLRLARNVHPLLATRGVPGTHEISLLHATLDALAAATPERPAAVPRFDKGLDTRLPPARWTRVRRAPDLILLEGWCIGVPAQSAAQLAAPLNVLERADDADGRWRRHVNAQLRLAYAPLWRRLDRLVLLEAPSYGIVRRWRDEQERALRRRGAPRALSPAALRRFLLYYERLSRHALATLPGRADLCIVLDERRRVRGLLTRG